MSEVELERRLTEMRDDIREDIRELKTLLVGGNGDDGALGRLTKLEERHGFVRKCFVWAALWIVGLTYMVVPAYFRQRWGE